MSEYYILMIDTQPCLVLVVERMVRNWNSGKKVGGEEENTDLGGHHLNIQTACLTRKEEEEF